LQEIAITLCLKHEKFDAIIYSFPEHNHLCLNNKIAEKNLKKNE